MRAKAEVGEVMKYRIILLASCLTLLSPFSEAQQAPPVQGDANSIPVPFSAPERNALMQMCATAHWASRVQYEGACDALRGRFQQAETAATEAAKIKAEAEAKAKAAQEMKRGSEEK